MFWGSTLRIPAVLSQLGEVRHQRIITYLLGSTWSRGAGTTYAQPTLDDEQHNTIADPSARLLFAESVAS